jgi:transcriptional regulator with XRE-family HTH domain
MSKEPKGRHKDKIKAAYEFALGEITTLEEFERKHPAEEMKWDHLKMFKKYPYLWGQFIEKLPVPYRIKACMDAEGFSVEQLRKYMGITVNDYIIKEKFEKMKNKGIQHTLLKLAIVFDLPLKYLRGFDTKLLVVEDFEEYDHLIVNNKISLTKVIELTLSEESNRNIQGFIIDNSNKEISFIHKDNAYIRVEKNIYYFRFEIFLVSKPDATAYQIEELLKQFQGSVRYIFKEDSLLRKIPKLTLIGTYKNTISFYSESFSEYISELNSQPRIERIYPFDFYESNENG